MEVISRKEAEIEGLVHFFTGIECMHGHIAQRFCKNGRCVDCNLEAVHRWNKRNSKKLSQLRKLESQKEYQRQYQKTDKRIKYRRHYNRKRVIQKLQRIPKWANLKSIKKIYNSCPKNMQVDHIIPLKGKLVSGLHVENNLQYLSQKDNRRKSNRFEVEHIINALNR